MAVNFLLSKSRINLSVKNSTWPQVVRSKIGWMVMIMTFSLFRRWYVTSNQIGSCQWTTCCSSRGTLRVRMVLRGTYWVTAGRSGINVNKQRTTWTMFLLPWKFKGQPWSTKRSSQVYWFVACSTCTCSTTKTCFHQRSPVFPVLNCVILALSAMYFDLNL